MFTLLVKQHPDFTNFRIEGAWPWGWAQKREGNQLTVP